MAKNAGNTLLEEIFKEPIRAKESLKEEIKSEDFGLILTQWKASSSRKSFVATTNSGKSIGGLIKPAIVPTAPLAGQEPASTILPLNSMQNPATPTESTVQPTGTNPADEKGKKATLFWNAMRNRGNPSAALVFYLQFNIKNSNIQYQKNPQLGLAKKPQ